MLVERWLVKPEKQEGHIKVMQKFRKFIKDNPEMFKGMKSVKEYSQMFGGIAGMNIWLIEYDSLADYEKEMRPCRRMKMPRNSIKNGRHL